MWDLNSLFSHIPFLMENRHLCPWVTGQWIKSDITLADMETRAAANDDQPVTD